MDKIKSISVRRLSFNRKVKCALNIDQKVKSLAAFNDDSSLLTEDDKGSSSLKHKNTILKIRSCVMVDDLELVNKYQDLFDKDSSEVLLKRYKCIYSNQFGAVLGKMYISSNYLCFVKSKDRRLELVIRLTDVETYTVSEAGVNIFTCGQLYSFKEFDSESWFGFLSNYLRLTKRTNNKIKFNISTDSSSISTSISSLINPNRPSERSSNLKPPEVDHISLTSNASSKMGQSPISQSPQSSQISSLPILDLKNPLDSTITMVSDVAYKASCIPLLILTRVLSFGMGLANSSLQITTSFNFFPPRALTKNIAYVMLAFLTISMAYMYCRLERLPMDDPTWIAYGSSHKNTGSGFDCGGDFEKLASSLRSLSETLQRLEARLKEDEMLMNLRTGP